ncbi:MAG: hypothetical protein P8Y68_05530 [Anaerolineales bacterium]
MTKQTGDFRVQVYRAEAQLRSRYQQADIVQPHRAGSFLVEQVDVEALVVLGSGEAGGELLPHRQVAGVQVHLDDIRGPVSVEDLHLDIRTGCRWHADPLAPDADRDRVSRAANLLNAGQQALVGAIPIEVHGAGIRMHVAARAVRPLVGIDGNRPDVIIGFVDLEGGVLEQFGTAVALQADVVQPHRARSFLVEQVEVDPLVVLAGSERQGELLPVGEVSGVQIDLEDLLGAVFIEEGGFDEGAIRRRDAGPFAVDGQHEIIACYASQLVAHEDAFAGAVALEVHGAVPGAVMTCPAVGSVVRFDLPSILPPGWDVGLERGVCEDVGAAGGDLSIDDSGSMITCGHGDDIGEIGTVVIICSAPTADFPTGSRVSG